MKNGSCCCGEVKYRMLADPIIVHCCHCTDCQKHTGGAFAINALIETKNIDVLSGAPEVISMPTESGRPHDIHRCPKCKVAVWSDYGRRAGLRFLRVSTLDKPHGIEPDVHIYTRSKLPWVGLPESAKRFEAFYKPDEVMSAETRARAKAAMG